MKHLVIGIDGGTERILRYFEMPFTKELIEKSRMRELQEDVWSRGWAEMYTGMHARETRAFYELPNLDGTHRFNRKFGYRTASENPQTRFLWDELDEKGVKSLFMNIPTTYPAPKLKHGVFVAGAGGGLNDVSTIPDGLCQPPESKEILEDAGYVVDLRYGPSGIKELEVLFQKLNEMMVKRAEGFVKLAKQYGSEFGFLAFRATTIVQYVAMSEIEMIIGDLEMPEIGQAADERPIHALIKEHYRELDRALEHLFTELQPEHFILTADHGHVPFLKRANMTPLLVELGFQKEAKAGKSIKKMISKMLPQKLFVRVAQSAPKGIRQKVRGFDVKRSLAFANTNIHGVYVNDARRFGGPVREGKNLDKVVDEIVETLNRNEQFLDAGMKARPYRRDHLDAHFADYLPDVWIDFPDDVFFDSNDPKFLTPNKQFAPILNLKDVPSDVNSGQKGKKPLFFYDEGQKNLVPPDGDLDLTLVYRMVTSFFEKSCQNS
ncbi:MAG: alkaline phosphatase family protein [Akkermansiaceae bacterium]